MRKLIVFLLDFVKNLLDFIIDEIEIVIEEAPIGERILLFIERIYSLKEIFYPSKKTEKISGKIISVEHLSWKDAMEKNPSHTSFLCLPRLKKIAKKTKKTKFYVGKIRTEEDDIFFVIFSFLDNHGKDFLRKKISHNYAQNKLKNPHSDATPTELSMIKEKYGEFEEYSLSLLVKTL